MGEKLSGYNPEAATAELHSNWKLAIAVAGIEGKGENFRREAGIATMVDTDGHPQSNSRYPITEAEEIVNSLLERARTFNSETIATIAPKVEELGVVDSTELYYRLLTSDLHIVSPGDNISLDCIHDSAELEDVNWIRVATMFNTYGTAVNTETEQKCDTWDHVGGKHTVVFDQGPAVLYKGRIWQNPPHYTHTISNLKQDFYLAGASDSLSSKIEQEKALSTGLNLDRYPWWPYRLGGTYYNP